MSPIDMNEENILQRLARRANEAASPAVDVSGAVLRSLASERATVVRPDRSLLFFTMATVAAASVALVIGLDSWSVINSPGLEVVQSFDVVDSFDSLLP